MCTTKKNAPWRVPELLGEAGRLNGERIRDISVLRWEIWTEDSK